MPERTGDPNGVWRYELAYPGADLKVNPVAVRAPQLVEAVGLDGRFAGALRPFPGMADKTVHGVPAPGDDGVTIPSIDNIVHAQYVAVRKGNTNETLRGIAYVGDNQNGDGQALYFAYRDSSDDSEDVVMLEDFKDWTDFRIDQTLGSDDFDITSLGRYIYLAASADTTSTVTSFQNKETPYNKAYWWDFKINSWDRFVDGFDDRFMGLLPRRTLAVRINEDDPDGTPSADSEDAMDAQTYGTGGFGPLEEGYYTYAAELISVKHNVRSWLRWRTKLAFTSPNSSIRWDVDQINLAMDGSGTTNQLKNDTSIQTAPIAWGISHSDAVRLWRAPSNNLVDADLIGKYTLMGNLYVTDWHKEHEHYDAGGAHLTLTIDNDVDALPAHGDFKATWFVDGALVQQTLYDPWLHGFGPAPRFKRLQEFDGLLIGITDVAEPATPDDEWDEAERQPEAIAWSSLTTDESENFPAENQYRSADASEQFLVLERAGDHMFAVSNAAIYKTTRSGSKVVINRIHYRVGGVSRHGQTGVGNLLFVITPAGLKQVNGDTGEVQSVSNLDRVILDDSEWAGTLADVHLEYDAKVGALIALNTSTDEAYILWEATGAITKLEDAPWAFMTSGPDVLTNGPHRAYMITSSGEVHTIDAARQMGKRTMCGTPADETCSGTADSGSTTTVLKDAGALFPNRCVGFKVYMLSGDLAGESATITARDSDTQLTVDTFSGSPADGDEYAVAPVVTRVVLPQVVSQGGQEDPFVRKTCTSISVALSNLGGETGGDDVYPYFTVGVKKQGLATVGSSEKAFSIVPDQTAARVNFASVQLYPYFECKTANVDYELQALMVKGVLGVSEAQSRQT